MTGSCAVTSDLEGSPQSELLFGIEVSRLSTVPAYVTSIPGRTQRNLGIQSCCLALKFQGCPFCPWLCCHHDHPRENTEKLQCKDTEVSRPSITIPAYVATIHGKTQRNFSTKILKFQGRLLPSLLMLPPSSGKHKKLQYRDSEVSRLSIIVPAYVASIHRKTQRNFSIYYLQLLSGTEVSRLSILSLLVLPPSMGKHTETLASTVAVWH